MASVFGRHDANNIPEEEIKSFVQELIKERSYKTACDTVQFNKSMWKWGIKNFKQVEKNPFSDINIRCASKNRSEYYFMEHLWTLINNPDKFPFQMDHYRIMKALIFIRNSP